MTFSELLLKRNFWIFFVFAVIVLLYLYGLMIINDNSELTKTKSNLEIAKRTILENEKVISIKNKEINKLNSFIVDKNEEISNLKYEIEKKNEEISNFDSELVKKNERISYLNSELYKKNKEFSNLNSELIKRNTEVSNLNSELVKRNSRKNEINSKAERLSEPYHPYGKNYSKIIVYTTCENSGTIQVWIDNIYKGNLTEYYYRDSPDCNESRKGSVVVALVRSGKHNILAKSSERKTWNFDITINEDDCRTLSLKCKK